MQRDKVSTKQLKKAASIETKEDVVSFMADLVLKTGKLSKEELAAIDQETRLNYGKSPAYVLQKSPSLRQSVRDAVGTYDEIGKRFEISRVTVWRYRKGR